MPKAVLLLAVLTLFTFNIAHADFTGQPTPTPAPGERIMPAKPKGPIAQLKDFLYENPGYLMMAVGIEVHGKCVSYFASEPDRKLRASLQNQCMTTTALLINQLDVAPSNIQEMKVVMSFHHELMHFVMMPEVQNMLTEFVSDDSRDLKYLQEQVALLPGAPTWIDFISVVFQDALPSHLNYVQRNLPAGQDVFFSIYKKANRKFYDLLFEDQQRATVSTENVGTARLYHYFVIRSLSERMVREGSDPRVAAFVSFLFNYIYKIEELQGPLKTAITEPATITDAVTIQDVYNGYVGAYAGTWNLISKNDFYAMFAADTRRALRTIAQQK